MSINSEDIKKLRECTCLNKSPDLEPEDLKDADLCDHECPIHGNCLKIESDN